MAMRSILSRLPEFAKAPLRRWIWRQMSLSASLDSGLRVQINCHADWTVYHEIFGCGQYDRAIEEALNQRPAGKMVVCDLGANVGYFTLRLADQFWKRRGSFDGLEVHLVEGAPLVVEELTRRLSAEHSLAGRITILPRLAGARSGKGRFQTSPRHFGGHVGKSAQPGAIEVEYLDLINYFQNTDTIDLLKCDVEGSEIALLREQAELFGKVARAVFEFHPPAEGWDECLRILSRQGLSKKELLRSWDGYSLWYFCRP